MTIFFLVVPSCTGVTYEYQYPSSETLRIPIVFHVRSQHDIKRRIPVYWSRLSEPLFWDGKIKPIVDDILFDVPNLTPDTDSHQQNEEFFRLSRDGRIHIFFVHEIHKNGGQYAGYNGIQVSGTGCESFILIQDDTEVKTIAHEIAHYLGVNHVEDDEFNVMNKKQRNISAIFRPKQYQTMRRKIREQRAFCGMPIP